MRRSCSSWYCLGLPLRDASRRPDKPSCAKRPRHLLTVAGRVPTRSATAWLPYLLNCIVPVDPLARSLASFEAVLGQFYVAITMFRLVTLRLEGPLEDH